MTDNTGTDNTGTTRSDILCETPGGVVIYRNGTSIVARLPRGHSVLSTSWLNGGYHEDLRMVFNHQLTGDACRSYDLEGGSIDTYLRLTAVRLGFEPACATGMLTGADMVNAAVVTHTFRDLSVTAVVTGGIEVNGGRAGDPASFYEENGEFGDLGGTINTMVFIGASLPPETMTRVVVTAAEAKATVLQELMAPSQYSTGIATGSGTDMITVVSDRTSPFTVTNAGKHAKLGELIARCVRDATRDTLFRQTGLGPASQQNMLVRLRRFGITEEDIWEAVAASPHAGGREKDRFLVALTKEANDPVLVAATAAVLHIADEVLWGLLPEEAGRDAVRRIMSGIIGASGTTGVPDGCDDGDGGRSCGKTIPEEWVGFLGRLIEQKS
jgi:adenosylcobinamide hydrolase